MYSELTHAQIQIGCELKPYFEPTESIKTRIPNAPGKAHCKKLVDHEIAEMCGNGRPTQLRRGRKWDEFYAVHGYKDTKDGLEDIERLRTIDELFGG